MNKKTFPVILPSNSNPHIYPNNTPSEFSVNLTNPIYLQGNYEVALSEITYYNDIALLKNNYIEIYKNDYVDDCFEISGNNFDGEWNFKKIPLPQFEHRLYTSNLIEQLEKNEDTQVRIANEVILLARKLSTLFTKINRVFNLTFDNQWKVRITASTPFRSVNKKALLYLGEDLVKTLGFSRLVFSTEEDYESKFQGGREIRDWNAILIPLYAMKNKRKIVIKSRGERFKDVSAIAKRIMAVLPSGIIDTVVNVEHQRLIMRKLVPMTDKNWSVMEMNNQFRMAFTKMRGAPYLVDPNDPIEFWVDVNHLQKQSVIQSEWSLIVYTTDIDLNQIRKEKKLKTHLNLNVDSLKTPADLVYKLNEHPQEYSADEYAFFYEALQKRIKLKVSKDYEIMFDKGLNNILGFSDYVARKTGEYIADKAPSLVPGVNNLYIYTNITDYTRVGNVEAPLLRTIPLSSEHHQLVNREFINYVFVPVNRTIIDRIDVSIRDDEGELVNFKGGITVLTLIFRPCQD